MLTFAFALLQGVDLVLLVICYELIDSSGVLRGCVIEIFDEKEMHLSPCSGVTVGDFSPLSASYFEMSSNQ